ncbi:hypothetical protein K3495_g2789 [Podosphaera aphanis]|nr:hypothetical protein K3495_g2789 [Podosphaera aphanis]
MSRDDLECMSELSLTNSSEPDQSFENENGPPSPPFSFRSSLTTQRSVPTIWSLLRGTAINLILPFINGLMLGFGELFAHEAAYRLGWGGTKVFPLGRSQRTIAPGVEVRADTSKKRETRHLNDANNVD